MSAASLISRLVDTFKAQGRIVIVGASLAGLRAAEALREKGFRGPLTIIGDEPHEPYDRPPLSKQVLKGWVPADHTKLPRLVSGRRATGGWVWRRWVWTGPTARCCSPTARGWTTTDC